MKTSFEHMLVKEPDEHFPSLQGEDIRICLRNMSDLPDSYCKLLN